MKKILLILVLALILIGCSRIEVVQPEEQQGSPQQNNAVQTQEPAAEPDVQEPVNTAVECNNDAECGEEVIGESFCFQGNIMTPKRIPKCSFPGTINSYCRQESKDVTTLCSKGSEFCRDGKCLVIADQPCNDTDDGLDYETAGRVTDGLLEVFVDKCLEDEKTLIEAYCSDGEKGRGLTEEHRCLHKCSGGRCVDNN